MAKHMCYHKLQSKTSQIYLFKRVIEADNVKNYKWNMPVIDRGVFHNQKLLQSIDTSFMSFSPFTKRVDKILNAIIFGSIPTIK